jgi:competence protein ComEA
MSWKTGLAAAIVAAIFGVAPLAHAQMQQKPAAAEQAHRPPRTAAPVQGACNINSADQAQLSLLPGVGPVRAKAIIAHRQKTPFKTAEELVKVKGIGRKTFARLRPYVTVSGPTTIARISGHAPAAR